jgi:pimeloyl-ACP methyl ester carboxylesterase
VAERLIYLVGASSRRGDGRRLFAGLLHYLGAAGGVEDVVEASYRAGPEGEPLDYGPADTARPLVESIDAVAAVLGHQRRLLGIGGRLHLLGWSLGGAMLFEAAARLTGSDPSWQGAFGAIVTYSSPLLGCDVDGIVDIGTVAAGLAGRELCQRGGDAAHRAWVEASAARLRIGGARLVTLGAEGDAIVTPSDSIVPAPGEPFERYLMRPKPRLGTDLNESRLGHGGILADAAAWRLTLEAIQG